MPQTFAKNANIWARLILWGGLGGLIIYTTTSWAVFQSSWATGEDRVLEQPVPFSHEHHVAGVGLDCRYCHTTFETSRFAGLPPSETCLHCHAHLYPDAPYLAPVRDSFRTGEPVAWQRVNDLPDFVYFDHSAHVSAGVGCETCHGRVDRMPLMAQGAPLTMAWCVDCHEAPWAHLRPPDAVTEMGWTAPGGDAVAYGRRLAAERGIAPDTSCSTCHR